MKHWDRMQVWRSCFRVAASAWAAAAGAQFHAHGALAANGSTPESYSWKAETASPPARNQSAPASVHGHLAARFRSAGRTQLDLTPDLPWRDFTGPLTLRILFEPTQPPHDKTPLLSKWEMKAGRRSFELGLMPDARPYFDVTGSGHWDSAGRELVAQCRVEPGHACALAAVFEPGSRLSLFLNGHHCGTLRDGVPAGLHLNDTPLLLGAQPPGLRWADANIASLVIDRRVLSTKEISAWASSLGLTGAPLKVESPIREGWMDLSIYRRQVRQYCDSLQVEGKPSGVLRQRALPTAPVTLYASCDVAWIRACLGENLTQTLTSAQRQQWIDQINSYARPDGTYPGDRHSLQHANGMVIGALAVLGGKQKYPVSLYDEFDAPDEIEPWLEKIRWDRQWSASHLFWGGMHCYSFSRRCTDAWRSRVFRWLDANLDPQTGWWRRGVAQAGQPIEVLGGAAHIWPVYQHHHRPFPHPRQVIDSILAMQQPDGSWLGFGKYMELDALYGLAYMRSLAPDHRATEIAAAARRHGSLVREQCPEFLATAPDAHPLLALVGALALLQQLDPDHFRDQVQWSDIFSDPRFYRTDQVEVVKVR